MASTRRLAAIMFTDMVGFTSRTQSDERGSLRLLKEQEELVAPVLASQHGRTVKSTGDGYLVEFPSALQATECAVAIQARLRTRNSERPAEPPIELRIGIHLGDVEERGADIFGDAVNIASRVQPVADPGGIVVSQQVFDQVRNKIELQLDRLEPKSLKGIRFPMDIYRVVLPWNAAPASGAVDPARRLAVLPFSNISPDPNDAYISDGLTEEVITVLSQLGELRVIARTSVDTYRSSPKPIPQIGVELGVSWILEGSVRKAGTRLRITAQLIDAKSQEHLWASTYDRELDDVFAIQSEMAKRVAEALQIRLLDREAARLDRRHTPSRESYLEYLQGRTALRGVQEADLRRAKAHLERALELDERNAAAHAGLADVVGLLGSIYHHVAPQEWWAETQRHTARALELDPDLAEAHTSLALGLSERYEYDRAEREFRRAIELNPSYAGAHGWYGSLLAAVGRPEDALREYALAEELDPFGAIPFAEDVNLRILLGQFEEAAARLERLAVAENRGILYHDRKGFLAYAKGDIEAFRSNLDELERLLPNRPEMAATRAALAAEDGDAARTRALLVGIEAMPEPIRPDMQIARIYCFLGDLDACFRWLDIARRERRLSVSLLRYGRWFSDVRSDPRYAELLGTMHLKP